MSPQIYNLVGENPKITEPTVQARNKPAVSELVLSDRLMPPTGPIRVTEIFIFRVRDGLVAEQWCARVSGDAGSSREP